MTIVQDPLTLPDREKLDAILSHITHLEVQMETFMKLMDKYLPVLEAYLDPAASGPGAWAVRRKLRKP